jgi:hypothetical protein
MKLLTQLATMTLKTKVHLLVKSRQLTQTNNGGVAGTNRAEAMVISPQGIGQYESVPPVILGAGWKISITETIWTCPVF